jgi:membrane-associated phospholipid phosphatase
MTTIEIEKPCHPSLMSQQTIIETPYISSERPSLVTGLHWLAVPFVFISLGFLALSVDCSIGRWCVEKNCPVWLENLFSTIEPFGNGLGVAIICITIFCLDVKGRWALPRILCSAYLAGLAANGLKLLLARSRPYSFDFCGGVWTTFGAWLPGVSAGSIGQSFPSGHTTTAVALAIALIWVYPRGRFLFPIMAVLVGCQRIEAGAHFLSDVLWGAALGSFIALSFIKIGVIPHWFDLLECRLKRILAFKNYPKT